MLVCAPGCFPALSQVLARWSRPFSTLAAQVRRSHLLVESVLLVRPAVHQDDGSLAWDVGTRVSPGARKSTHFCLEYRCRALAPSTIGPASRLVPILFLPGSRTQTGCFPLSLRAPRLRLCCGDSMSSTRRTLSALSLHRPTLHWEDERRQDSTAHHAPGKNCWKWMPSQRSRSSPASVALIGPACPVNASRLFASRCFHSCGQNWGRPSKGAVAPLHGDKEESLLL